MNTSFYNTISASGEDLKELTGKAKFQAEYILLLFKENHRAKFTPHEVKTRLKRFYGKKYPITSIRARITTLTKNGFLIKSDKADVKGIYKINNHAWKLKTAEDLAA